MLVERARGAGHAPPSLSAQPAEGRSPLQEGLAGHTPRGRSVTSRTRHPQRPLARQQAPAGPVPGQGFSVVWSWPPFPLLPLPLICMTTSRTGCSDSFECLPCAAVNAPLSKIHVSVVPKGATRGRQLPRNWASTLSQASVWTRLLELELGSSSAVSHHSRSLPFMTPSSS